MTPAVAEKQLQKRLAADRKAASDAAAKARRAGISSSPAAPGRNTGASSNAKPQKKSVRESLEDAIAATRTGPRV
jgi:hypothetical protein